MVYHLVVKVKSLSRVWPLVTPWTAAYQAPPSMGFSRQEYWSGVPLPSSKIQCSCPQFHLFHVILFKTSTLWSKGNYILVLIQISRNKCIQITFLLKIRAFSKVSKTLMAQGFKALFLVGFESGVATSTIKTVYPLGYAVFIFVNSGKTCLLR